ncbi:MAG: phosphoadenylyl-sulfate reductase [Planctomycetes bacterium]|nr:phosphoadenylyl-sulfate reductase [Planctomycetota bacterium]
MPRISDDEIAAANEELDGQPPEAVLRWAVKRFGSKLLFSTAFGAEGCCILHMLAEIGPGTRLINLDTGYQFSETLELRERIKERYGLEVELIQPELTVPQYEANRELPLYKTNPTQCCHDRKIVPLRKALLGYDAWISSIRKDQTKDRAVAKVVQWDAKFNLVKVNPLLSWTFKDVWNFIHKYEVPYNPLHDQNYPSIGCWPCTSSVNPGDDERAGRWAGSKKKECGLHVVEQESGSDFSG